MLMSWGCECSGLYLIWSIPNPVYNLFLIFIYLFISNFETPFFTTHILLSTQKLPIHLGPPLTPSLLLFLF